MQVGYLSSWSPYATYRHRHPDREDPLVQFKKEAMEACKAKDGSHIINIVFPIFLLLAKLK
jgi:hypothetical protein